MDETEDRVARAIFSSWRKSVDDYGLSAGPRTYDDLPEDQRKFGLAAARAAIAAMPDPPYPSIEAMKAAVELEIHAALGRVQTVAIGRMIQKAIDASVALTS